MLLRFSSVAWLLASAALLACGLESGGLADAPADAGFVDAVADVAVDAPVDAAPDSGPQRSARGALVSAGTVASSTSFKAIVTLGQSPASNGVLRSPSFTFLGGVTGATQTQ
jgi:hypothetical protein